MIERETLLGLPAGERVLEGIADLAAGRRSVAALWLAQASVRLERAGLRLPALEPAASSGSPELELYELLRERTGPGDDSFYRYNALRRDLTSFLAAFEARAD